MKLTKCHKGDGGMPLTAVGGKDGWSTGCKAPSDGMLVVLDPVDRGDGGVFISDWMLGDVGYVSTELSIFDIDWCISNLTMQTMNEIVQACGEKPARNKRSLAAQMSELLKKHKSKQ